MKKIYVLTTRSGAHAPRRIGEESGEAIVRAGDYTQMRLIIDQELRVVVDGEDIGDYDVYILRNGKMSGYENFDFNAQARKQRLLTTPRAKFNEC